ncbi:MAG: serine/threonine protein kinase, partial [Myxococcota bacterium]|nr:serine/threonine protein kinase [Myxococcota bacterium]
MPFPERYEDLGRIARGGWGEVRRVRDLAMDRVIVAKVLAWEHVESERLVERFLNEARVTASLDHPGIVPVLDGGTLPDDRPWFAMKEVVGRTFREILDEPTDPIDPATMLRRHVEVLVRISEIVGYAHERRVVHRDLKPSNVMVGRFGEVLVLDWGVARRAGDPVPQTRARPKGDASTTQPGDILGTTSYMAPEQARGAHRDVGPAADVYAIGLVLFEILHGQRARRGTQITQWSQATRGENPPIERGPEELRTICERALRVDPSARFPDGMAIATALRAWLDGAARVQRA